MNSIIQYLMDFFLAAGVLSVLFSAIHRRVLPQQLKTRWFTNLRGALAMLAGLTLAFIAYREWSEAEHVSAILIALVALAYPFFSFLILKGREYSQDADANRRSLARYAAGCMAATVLIGLFFAAAKQGDYCIVGGDIIPFCVQ